MAVVAIQNISAWIRAASEHFEIQIPSPEYHWPTVGGNFWIFNTSNHFCDFKTLNPEYHRPAAGGNFWIFNTPNLFL